MNARTDTAPTRTAPRSRSTYRPFAVEVARAERLSPHFVRVTFRGDDLNECADVLLDQRIKLVFADAEQIAALSDRLAEDGFDWYAWWLDLPDDTRPPMRTYTIRAVRPERREVDIDFVAHGLTGPASRFAHAARPGDRLVLIGPDRTVPEAWEQGLAWRPGEATEVLLAGDETAVPALSNIVESLPPDVTGHAFLEVPAADDILDVRTDSDVTLTWLARGEDQPPGTLLHDTVAEWVAARGAAAADGSDADDPVLVGDLVWEEASGTGELFVWLAGESSAITRLRRHLVNEAGLDKRSMAFMGYWKIGRAAVG